MIDRVLTFLGDGNPTAAESLAALGLLLGTIAAAALMAAATVLMRRVVGTGRIHRDLWAPVALMIIGLILLGAGAVRHLTYEPHLAGGSVREAHDFLGH